MKGILKKTQSGWIVNYEYTVTKNDWCTIPLHPKYLLDVDLLYPDSLDIEVEFEIVNIWERNVGDIKHYAKIIHYSVEPVEMVEDNVEKLAKEEFPINYQPNGRTLAGGVYELDINFEERRGFIKGYNKAKETLFTEEQMLEYAEWVFNLDTHTVLTMPKKALLQEYISQSVK